MQINDLKRAIIELLKSDEEFRYTVVGLLGLEDIRSSLKRLAETMVELAEAQARTEARLAELAERTDARFSEVDARFAELAEAQARTESRIAKLEESLGKLRSDVGKLSANFGFTLEEIAVTKIPRLLSEAGIEIRRSNIKLRHIIDINGREVEVDLYVVGRDVVNNRDITVIGEVKGRIDTRDVKKFADRFKGIEAFKFIFGHTIKRSAEDEASKRGIRLYATYS